MAHWKGWTHIPFVLAFTIGSAFAAVPESPELTGKVIDADSARPIAGAIVIAKVGGDGGSMFGHGHYTFYVPGGAAAVHQPIRSIPLAGTLLKPSGAIIPMRRFTKGDDLDHLRRHGRRQWISSAGARPIAGRARRFADRNIGSGSMRLVCFTMFRDRSSRSSRSCPNRRLSHG